MPGESLFSAPKQQRSREALDRVVQAATELLQEVGYDSMRITEVSERANVGPASIYARVGSKHGLLLAVQARMVEELDRDSVELLGPLLVSRARLRTRTFEAVTAVGEVFRRHGSLLQVFIVRGDVDEAIIERASAGSVRLSGLFTDALLARRDEIAHRDPERAVDVCFRLVYDTLARRLVRGPKFESPRELGWDEQVEELATACAAYLLHAQDVAPR